MVHINILLRTDSVSDVGRGGGEKKKKKDLFIFFSTFSAAQSILILDLSSTRVGRYIYADNANKWRAGLTA